MLLLAVILLLQVHAVAVLCAVVVRVSFALRLLLVTVLQTQWALRALHQIRVYLPDAHHKERVKDVLIESELAEVAV